MSHSLMDEQTKNQIFLLENLNGVLNARDQIVEMVRTKGYALLRNLFDPTLLRNKLKNIYDYANSEKHLASAGVSPMEIRKNISKWSIGGQSNSQANLARFMLTIYNPLFQANQFHLHDEFNQLIAIRDCLANRELLTDEKIGPSHFNACRLQLYPAGGGFMGAHVDTRAVSSLNEMKTNNDAYIQLVLLLTQKGVDYDTGGAFVVKEDVFIDSEKNSYTGDVLVYDGATMHGVADIDSTVPFSANNLRGRLVALATIYNKA